MPPAWPLLLALLGAAAARPTETTTQDVYTYFTPGVVPSDKELEAIQLWNSSWTLAGWRTHVVGPADALNHPQYKVRLALRRCSACTHECAGER